MVNIKNITLILAICELGLVGLKFRDGGAD